MLIRAFLILQFAAIVLLIQEGVTLYFELRNIKSHTEREITGMGAQLKFFQNNCWVWPR